MKSPLSSRHFFLLALITIILRLPSLFYTFLDVDESQFATAAHVLMEEGQLYKNAVDTKPPLIYFFYQIIFSLFGKYNMTAVHAASIFVALLTAYLILKIGTRIKDERTGYWAALFFAIFSTTYLPKFIATSITSVMILPLTLAVYLVCHSRHERRLGAGTHYFVAGVLTAIAFLFKYQGGIQLPILGLFLLYQYWKKQIPLYRLLNQSLQLTLGFFIPLLITALWIHQTGIWNDFMEWSFRGSAKYIQSGVETIPFWSNLLIRGGSFILSTALLWILLIPSPLRGEGQGEGANNLIFHPPPNPLPSREGGLISLWFFLSLIPVCMGGRFYGHYFLQILPPLCLLAAMTIPTKFSPWVKRGLVSGLIVPALLFGIMRVNYEAFDTRFPDDQLFQQERVGKWLKENTKEEETLFVWGFATAIYFHAERKSTSRFLWTDLLTGKIPGSNLSNQKEFDTANYSNPKAWEKFWEDMNKNPPDYFIDTSPANIHSYGKYPVSQYPQLEAFLQKNYVSWKTVEGVDIYHTNKSL